MNAPSLPTRSVCDRMRHESARPRALVYALASALLASPHSLDPRSVKDASAALAGAEGAWAKLAAVLVEVGDTDLATLQLTYSGLFEVGDEGPPVPMREEHLVGGSGRREEVVRFYHLFGYSLAETFAWQPDHLSIELEFLHFLCLREAAAETDELALPYQLAQFDFATRHVGRCLPMVKQQLEALNADNLYQRVVAAVGEVVAEDLDWQRGTVRG